MNSCAVALIMLLDFSGSYNVSDWQRQVEGHARAFESQEVIGAIERESGIAVRAFAFNDVSRALTDWQVLRTQAEAQVYANELRRRGAMLGLPSGGTQTAFALQQALDEVERAPCEPDQRVLDVVTDGVSFDDPAPIRDEAEVRGVRINGLFVHTAIGAETTSRRQYQDGAEWMRDNVITQGGTLSRVNNWDAFVYAIRAKIVLEIASR
jgi:hypothetical protein